MQEEKSPIDYINSLPSDRQVVISKLREVILNNLPKGFEETMSYGMIGYVVPKSIYPPGYQPNPEEPLPFISIASQKNHVAFYHMGIQMFPELLQWFQDEYKKHVNTKLDMGVSCIRFKNMNKVPYELLGELCNKISVEDYVDKYASVVKKK